MFVASRSKVTFVVVRKVPRDATTIGVTACFHFFHIQRQHQQHAKHKEDYCPHGKILLEKENEQMRITEEYLHFYTFLLLASVANYCAWRRFSGFSVKS